MIEATLRCEAAAGVRWYSFSGSLFEVVDSGGLRNIYGPQLLSRAETAEPLDGKPATGVVYPCSTPGMKGTHTYLARWTVKTKTSADDPNPFVAKIARKQTVTCA